MSATMEMQGSWVQLEQSHLCVPLNMAKMAKRGVFVRHNRWNAIADQETSRRSVRREYIGSWVSGELKCEGCDEETPGYGSGKSHGRLPSMPNCHSTESPYMLDVQRHWCTNTRATQTADTRTDVTSVQNATCATHEPWGSWRFWNPRCATQIWVFTYSSSKCSIFQSWCICQGSQAR